MAKRLLIIDDSPDIVALLKVTLMAAGYQVHGVMDGMYGMKEALAFSPDLIILDICFPAGGGLPLLERFKERSPHENHSSSHHHGLAGRRSGETGIRMWCGRLSSQAC